MFMSLDFVKQHEKQLAFYKHFFKPCEKFKVNMNLYKLSGNKFGCHLDIVISLLEINSQEILKKKEKQKLLFIEIFTDVLFIIGSKWKSVVLYGEF